MIKYVQSSASQDVPPPYSFPDVRVNSFVWAIDVAKVQRYCDRFLNLGSYEERGFHYRPLVAWPYAMLTFLDYPSMISSDPHPLDIGEVPYPDRGFTNQREVFVSIPLARYGRGALGRLTETDVECILPFIVVDQPGSCICGREMLGLGKLLAEIEMGEGKYPDSFAGKVTMPGWQGKHVGQHQEMLTFIEVETAPLLPTFRSGSPPSASLATLFESKTASLAFGAFAGFSNFVDSISAGLVPTVMRTVGLKQYRDALHPDRAIYQALVSCRARYSNVRDFGFYDENAATITVSDTGSFREILNLLMNLGGEPNGERHQWQPLAALRFNADIDYDAMKVLHEFAIEGGDGIVSRPARSDLASRWFRPIRGLFAGETRA